MAKKKVAQADTTQAAEETINQPAAEAPAAEPVKGRRGRPKKNLNDHKPPADPFGDVLPNAKEQGSPADGNWRPTGDPVTDIATLEAQERFLCGVMNIAKEERDMAKAEFRSLMGRADRLSVTDGFSIEEKISLHKKADASERKLGKAEKEYKRAREGWQSIKGVIHRYLTDSDNYPLLNKKGGRAA